MGRIFRSCLQLMLKMVNSVGGLVGVAFILYGLWMKSVHSDPTLPWFIYTSLGLGVSLCLITCFGYIAANGHCIYFYMVLIVVLVMLEATITGNVILNKDWEEVFPNDTSGRFNEFKNFVRSNYEFCKWVRLTIMIAQGMSLFLAMILKVVSPNIGSSYDSDDSMNARQRPSIYMRDAQGQMMPLLIDEMSSKDTRAWSTIIMIYGIHGQGRKTLNQFDELHVTW